MPKRLTQQEFLKKSREKHGLRYDYSLAKYGGSQSSVTIICPEHGEFVITANHHLAGRGCIVCSTFASSNKRTTVWNEECSAYIIKNYPRKTVRECADILQISSNVVRHWLHKLKLRQRGIKRYIRKCEYLDDKFIYRIQKRAEQRNLKFELTETDVLKKYYDQNRRCALSGELIYYNKDPKKTTISVDRINSSKGYTVDNIQIVHKLANVAKWNLPDEEFYKLCERVYHNLHKKYGPDDRVFAEDGMTPDG